MPCTAEACALLFAEIVFSACNPVPAIDRASGMRNAGPMLERLCRWIRRAALRLLGLRVQQFLRKVEVLLRGNTLPARHVLRSVDVASANRFARPQRQVA